MLRRPDLSMLLPLTRSLVASRAILVAGSRSRRGRLQLIVNSRSAALPERPGNHWIFRRPSGSSRSGIDVGIVKNEVHVRRVDLGANLDNGRSLFISAGDLVGRRVVLNVDDSLGECLVIDAGARV